METIGDAYMVVGGLPERNTVHAECVANQALDMMYYCKQVLRPDKNEPIVVSECVCVCVCVCACVCVHVCVSVH